MRKAQSTLEYAVVIACICAALLAMRIYLKRGLQGKLRETADSLGSQYEPGSTESDITITQYSNVDTNTTTEDKTDDKGTDTKDDDTTYYETTTTTNIKESTETRSGWEKVY